MAELTEAQHDELVGDLHRLLATLTQTASEADALTRTVELDQGAVGRVSRVDALQAQKMAQAQQRRNELRRKQVLVALQAVDDHARIEPGMRVLVLGASGGVGTYAVQVAAARGAIVTGVASTAKLDLVAGLGATAVVDHTTTDPLATADPYDAILDLGGNHGLRRLRRALTPEGTLVIVGGEGGGRLIGGLDRQLRAVLWSRLVSQHLTTFVASEDHVHLERLAGLVVDGHVRPVVDRTFPLEGAPAAIDHLITGRARGKVVVTVATADREVGALLPPRA